MSNIFSAGYSGQQFKGYEEGFNNTLSAVDGYWYDPSTPPIETPLKYNTQLITFPGELTAAATKRLEYGPRYIFARLFVTATSKASAQSGGASVLTDFNNLARYTVTLPNGVSRPGCKCVEELTKEVGWLKCGPGSYGVIIEAVFQQLQAS